MVSWRLCLHSCREQVLAVCIVLVQPPLRVLFHAHTSSDLSLVAHVKGIVSFLFLGGACSDFCSLGWAVMACQLLLAVWLVLAMQTGLTGFVWLATVVLSAMKAYDLRVYCSGSLEAAACGPFHTSN